MGGPITVSRQEGNVTHIFLYNEKLKGGANATFTKQADGTILYVEGSENEKRVMYECWKWQGPVQVQQTNDRDVDTTIVLEPTIVRELSSSTDFEF